MVERSRMAEGTSSGPEAEGVSPGGSTGQAGVEGQDLTPTSSGSSFQRPWHISREYDPNRRDYTETKEGNWRIFTDPTTGNEVGRVLEIAGGAPATEINQLWEEAKAGDSDAAVGVLLLVDNMEAAEKKDNAPVYQQACDILLEYSQKDKLSGDNPKIVAAKRELKERDEAELQQHTPAEQAALRDLLYRLYGTEAELERVNNTLGLEATHKELFTEERWRKLRGETHVQITQAIADLTAKIRASASAGFLEGRKSLQEEIREAIGKLELEQKREKEQERRDQYLKPETWEEELEKEFHRRGLPWDKEPTFTQEQITNLPAFSEVIAVFKRQEQLSNTGDPNFSPEAYRQAAEVLSWYFHQARLKGVFDDLEERLEQKYLEFANSLLPHRELDQMDYYRGSRGRIVQKSYAEVSDDITDFFDTLLDPSKPQNVEHPARWNFLQRRGVTPQERDRWAGIRAEFVSRARAQMEDALYNLTQPARRVGISRISGEWNVLKPAEQFQVAREQGQDTADRPLFVEESSWKITLLGRDRGEIEQGADQAADSIIASAAAFTLEVTRDRMSLLLRAIEERTADLKNSEHVSEADAKKMINAIKHTVTNKIDFYVLNFLAGNLLMDQFAGYLEDRMRIAGVDKLRIIPAMNDGLVGLALHFLNDPQFRLYYRPQGFRGQLFDDDTTHKYIREAIKKKIIGLLTEYEFTGLNDRENILENRKKLMNAVSLNDFLSNFKRKQRLFNGKEFKYFTDEKWKKLKEEERDKYLTKDEQKAEIEKLDSMDPKARNNFWDSLAPDVRVEIRKWQYHHILDRVNALRLKQDKSSEEWSDLAAGLDNLKRARREFAREQNNFQRIKDTAETAFTTADRVMNIFGGAAELGGPSIIMDKGDFIRVEDATLFYKYAILQAAKGYAKKKDDGKEYGAEDNMALIRWRSRMWISRWKEAGLDRKKAKRTFDEADVVIDKKGKTIQDNRIILKNGQVMKFTLKEGFEETGLTEEEWSAFEEAVKLLRANGFTADFRGVKFEDIIKMDYLKPVVNNLLADYKSSESQINNPVVLEEVAKGRLTPIGNILRRLGLKGREGIPGKTTQQRIDNLTQMIEDSRALDAELERLAYFEATHGLPTEQIKDPRMLPFSADRIDYGFQGLPWGVKRLQHLKAFWYTNLRRTVSRAVDLVHAMPFSLPSMSKYFTFNNILELCWNAQSDLASGMESIDVPGLMMYAQSIKDQVYIRSVSEGGVDLKEGKVWGFLEKPLVDANSLWKVLRGKFPGAAVDQILKALLADPNRMGQDGKEDFVNHFQDMTLKRFAPIVVGTEKQLGEDRQAISSGAGFDENQKFALRFLEWLMSEKRKTKEHSAREEAGMEAFSEIRDIIKLIVTPNSYRPGSSIWDEVWRKLTPSHNIRLPDKKPEPTYTA